MFSLAFICSLSLFFCIHERLLFISLSRPLLLKNYLSSYDGGAKIPCQILFMKSLWLPDWIRFLVSAYYFPIYIKREYGSVCRVPSALNFTRGGFHLALVRLVSSVPLDFETAPFALYQVTYSTKRRTAPQPGSPKCAFYVIRTMPAKQPHGS